MPSHDLIVGLVKEDPADIGGPVHKVIADWLRISLRRGAPPDARCRTARTAGDDHRRDVATRVAGDCPGLASGVLDQQHLRVIQTFVRDLPADTPIDTVECAERFLAEQSTKLRPDQLEKVANRCAVLINPDGKFSDVDRARRRGFIWSAHGPTA